MGLSQSNESEVGVKQGENKKDGWRNDENGETSQEDDKNPNREMNFSDHSVGDDNNERGGDDEFEYRGITLGLLEGLKRAALAIDPNNPWSVARISNLLIGTHELLKERSESRWRGDQCYPSSINETLTGEEQCSIIELLRRRYYSTKHERLGVSYVDVVGKEANIFVSFAYSMDFFD